MAAPSHATSTRALTPRGLPHTSGTAAGNSPQRVQVAGQVTPEGGGLTSLQPLHPSLSQGSNLSATPILWTSTLPLDGSIVHPDDAATMITSTSDIHVASATTNHKVHHMVHGPLNPEKALKTGGLCFAPVYSEIDNADRRGGKRLPFALMSVGLQALTGIITGVAAYGVGFVSEAIGKLRLDATVQLAQDGNWGQAWFVSFSIMVCLALAGALPVILCVKTAGSSGIPAIIGILNGCDLQQDFQFKTLVVRLIGVTCAVSSGLAVGPEGPMIFIGACTGALLSRIPSNPAVWEYFGRPPSSMNHHVYLRDYISTGAACGIAAAFRAPIAGALFVIEEAASHFRREQLAKVFIGAIIAMLFATYLAGEEGILQYQVATGQNCRTWQWLQFIDYLFFVLVGGICGLAGALFNHINVTVATWRAKHVNATMPFRRTLEIVILCLLSSACWMLLPFFTNESSAGDPMIFSRGNTCIKDKWFPQIVNEAHIEGDVGLNLKYVPEPCLYGMQHNRVLCPLAWSLADVQFSRLGSQNARSCTHDVISGTTLKNHADVRSYCCNFTSMDRLIAGQFQVPKNASCSIDLGETFPSLRSKDRSPHISEDLWTIWHPKKGPDIPNRKRHRDDAGTLKAVHYNPMASLSLVSFDATAQNLFSRGAPYVLHPSVLLCFLPAFFLLAAVTSGSAIPSGLLLPMIVIGALIGRILAVFLISLQVGAGWYQSQKPEDSIWSAASQPFFYYFGGPLDTTAPLSTTGWLDPGVGAIIGAAAFLGGCSRISLTVTVMMVELTGDPTMIAPVGVATLTAVVVGNRFNHGLYHSLIDVASFPFLPDRWPKQIPKALRVEHVITQGGTVVCMPLMAQRPEVERVLREFEYTGFPVLDGSGAVVGFTSRKLLQQLLSEMTDTVDVGRVCDFHCVTIRASLPLEVAYDLFKRMEISHMIVVDNNHHPMQVLTRGSLLPWAVEERIGHRRMANVRSTIQRPRNFRPSGVVNDTFWTEHQSEAEHGQAQLTPTNRSIVRSHQPVTEVGLEGGLLESQSSSLRTLPEV